MSLLQPPYPLIIYEPAGRRFSAMADLARWIETPRSG